MKVRSGPVCCLATGETDEAPNDDVGCSRLPSKNPHQHWQQQLMLFLQQSDIYNQPRMNMRNDRHLDLQPLLLDNALKTLTLHSAWWTGLDSILMGYSLSNRNTCFCFPWSQMSNKNNRSKVWELLVFYSIRIIIFCFKLLSSIRITTMIGVQK